MKESERAILAQYEAQYGPFVLKQPVPVPKWAEFTPEQVAGAKDAFEIVWWR